MKKCFLFLILLTYCSISIGQPQKIAPPQSRTITIVGATIHVGNGRVIENGVITFDKGKITYIGEANERLANDENVINAKGKHIYPGLIEAATTLGLNEIDAVRAGHDEYEVGELNPNIRSITSFNTDARVVPTNLSNGITTCHIVPLSQLVCGSGSVVQLNAWNYEDAVLYTDNSMMIAWPYRPQARNAQETEKIEEQEKAYQVSIKKLEKMFDDALSYASAHDESNLKLEALIPLFQQKQKLIIFADKEKQMIDATLFANRYKLPLIIAGGAEAHRILPFLKENKVSIILGSVHALPTYEHDAIDIRFKIPLLLKQAGIPFCISMFNVEVYKQRSLPFTAGTAAAYGLDKEEALRAITQYPAQLLGIDKTTGTLEIGKDATLIISSGDVLDMRTSIIERVFIQGRDCDLMNSQRYQYERYKEKYDLK